MRRFQPYLPFNTNEPDGAHNLGGNEPLSVSDLTAVIKALIEGDPQLGDVRVAGELSNFTRAASGHLYFTLKDGGAQIKCAMWRMSALRLRGYAPRNGDAVIARGRIGVYERDGAYQLYVEAMTPQGVGDLYVEFERLKQKLQDEGLFDTDRKRRLPPLISRLGVVTSPDAAAFQDVLNVLRRRYPLVEVILAPTLVQGEQAPPLIVRAIQQLNEQNACDAILITRGGGSIEELWAFNDERVVRAVAESRIPTISGVGHEVDFTLTDFAADVRAPTPSAAAEMLTPDIADLRLTLDAVGARFTERTRQHITQARSDLDALARALRAYTPAGQMKLAASNVADLRARLQQATLTQLRWITQQVRALDARRAALSPQETLARGYAIVRRVRDGAVVRTVSDVTRGETLRVRVSDGEFETEVRTT
jgi:exodeoxyribonuclease VII large subunit